MKLRGSPENRFLHMFVCNLLTPICSISILVDLSGRSIVYERSLLSVTAGGLLYIYEVPDVVLLRRRNLHLG